MRDLETGFDHLRTLVPGGEGPYKMTHVGSASPTRDFFVSYTQADRQWAEWIAWLLEEDGYQVLIQAWDMVPGSNWIAEMDRGVRDATRTIAVLSKHYLSSVYGTAEWRAAWAGDPGGAHRKLLPLRVEDCDRPGLLAGVVGIDLFDLTEGEARERLSAAIDAAVVGRVVPATAPPFPLVDRVVPTAPRFPGTLPDVWNVPTRGPHFTGRDAELGRIRTAFATSSTMTVQTLHGMGGVGKSLVAAEYAHRYADDYDVVWWITAERPALITDQLAGLGGELGLQVADSHVAARSVRRVLRQRNRWLLIFDNAEESAPVGAVLPGGVGHVLVTTRRSGFGQLGLVLELEVLDRSASVGLICWRSPWLSEAHADSLADSLGDLPLALEQATAYLDRTRMPVADYLELLRTREGDLLRRGAVAGRDDRVVATLWSVSLERIRDQHPAAAELLTLCAYLGAEPIPVDLFTGHPDQLPSPLDGAATDPLAITDTIGALVDYSLVRRTDQGLVSHRLIQAVARQETRSSSLAVVLALLMADLPERVRNAPENLPRWRQLLPHVLAATGRDAEDVNERTGWLLYRAAAYLRIRGQASAACPLLERTLHIREAVYGQDHWQVGNVLIQLGWALRIDGKPAGAQSVYKRALRIRESWFGPDHPQVATALTNLGLTLSDLGEPAAARPLHMRALSIREQKFGPDHRHVASALTNLGSTLRELGDPDAARHLHIRALEIREAFYGPDHRHVASVLNNLAEALVDLGEAEAARPLFERALRIREDAYGPDHPRVATTLVGLGSALICMGASAIAGICLERALTIFDSMYGPNHPKTVQVREVLHQRGIETIKDVPLVEGRSD